MGTNEEQTNAQSVNSTDRPTPETDAMRHYLQLHGWNIDVDEPVKTIMSVVCRLERERDEALDQERIHYDNYQSLRAYAERLAEALGFYADASKYPAPLTGGLGSLYYDCGGVAKSTLAAHRAAKGTSL
jgi:hypothetical protein